MLLEYSSNNSGGSWWLKDEDWKAMEDAGWTVGYGKDRPFSKDGRYMGALAVDAEIETDDPKATIREWEKLTHQSAASQGCNCCGPPHSFSWTDDEGKTIYLDIVQPDPYWE